MNPNQEIIEEQKDERLTQLEVQMLEKSTLLDTLTQSIYQQSSEEMIVTIRERIQEVRRELEHLWHQQILIEQEIESQTLNPIKRCA
jgi:hypothetical protein